MKILTRGRRKPRRGTRGGRRLQRRGADRRYIGHGTSGGVPVGGSPLQVSVLAAQTSNTVQRVFDAPPEKVLEAAAVE